MNTEKTLRKKIGFTLGLRLKTDEKFFGPGVLNLMKLVDETHSLQMAAGTMGMSYSKAWKIMRIAEMNLGFELMHRHVGGVGGGGSELTEKGRDFIQRYERFQKETYAEASRIFLKHFPEEAQEETEDCK